MAVGSWLLEVGGWHKRGVLSTWISCAEDVFEIRYRWVESYPQYPHNLNTKNICCLVIPRYNSFIVRVIRLHAARLHTAYFHTLTDVKLYLSTVSTPPIITITTYI